MFLFCFPVQDTYSSLSDGKSLNKKKINLSTSVPYLPTKMSSLYKKRDVRISQQKLSNRSPEIYTQFSDLFRTFSRPKYISIFHQHFPNR